MTLSHTQNNLKYAPWFLCIFLLYIFFSPENRSASGWVRLYHCLLIALFSLSHFPAKLLIKQNTVCSQSEILAVYIGFFKWFPSPFLLSFGQKYIVSIWLWLASVQPFVQGWFRFSSSDTAGKINPEPHDDVGSVRQWKWSLQGIPIDISTLWLPKNRLAQEKKKEKKSYRGKFLKILKDESTVKN